MEAMTDSPVVERLTRLFDDISVRAPFNLGWSVDRVEAPLIVRVEPADWPSSSAELLGDSAEVFAVFAVQLQRQLEPILRVPVPPCPTHHEALVLVTDGEDGEWRCPVDDFSCKLGDYREALWPPGPEEPEGELGSLLAHRFRRRHLDGIARFSVRRDHGELVADIDLRPEADLRAITEAASPVRLAVTWLDAVSTVRIDRPATDLEPASRVLTLQGGGVAIRLALLRGTLRRARPDENCDLVVEGSGGRRTRVRLIPLHRLGGPGEVLVAEASGRPFADDGDPVACVGGMAPSGPVEGEPTVFGAGQLVVYAERPANWRQ
jgi:hypothetical protein